MEIKRRAMIPIKNETSNLCKFTLLPKLQYVQPLKVQIKQVSESCFLITINLFTI